MILINTLPFVRRLKVSPGFGPRIGRWGEPDRGQDWKRRKCRLQINRFRASSRRVQHAEESPKSKLRTSKRFKDLWFMDWREKGGGLIPCEIVLVAVAAATGTRELPPIVGFSLARAIGEFRVA